MPFVLFGQRRNIAVGVNEIIFSDSLLLDGTETQTIYIPFPSTSGPGSNNSVDPDTSTALTASDISGKPKQFTAKNLFVSIVLDTAKAQETDSLSAYYHPYTWSQAKSAWYKASNDSTFLVFDTRATYTSATVDWLDWTHGENYISFLAESLIWSTSGVAITFVQRGLNTDSTANWIFIDVYAEE